MAKGFLYLVVIMDWVSRAVLAWRLSNTPGVVSPPLPGAGQRVLELEPVKEFWYTSLHQLDLARQLLDGNRDAVRAYLHHFWSHWSGPNYIVDEKRIDHLADVYSAPGAFIASINWYRSSGNPVTAYAAETKPSPGEMIDPQKNVLPPPDRDLRRRLCRSSTAGFKRLAIACRGARIPRAPPGKSECDRQDAQSDSP